MDWTERLKARFRQQTEIETTAARAQQQTELDLNKAYERLINDLDIERLLKSYAEQVWKNKGQVILSREEKALVAQLKSTFDFWCPQVGSFKEKYMSSDANFNVFEDERTVGYFAGWIRKPAHSILTCTLALTPQDFSATITDNIEAPYWDSKLKIATGHNLIRGVGIYRIKQLSEGIFCPSPSSWKLELEKATDLKGTLVACLEELAFVRTQKKLTDRELRELGQEDVKKIMPSP